MSFRRFIPKKDHKADTYIVYACYNYLCTGIETPVPAMSWFYVYKDAQGSLKIDGSDLSNTEIAAYGEERLKDADVAELTATVNAAYEKGKNRRPGTGRVSLRPGRGVRFLEAAAEGTILTANDNSNVRAGASEDAEIIGGLAPGDEVEKRARKANGFRLNMKDRQDTCTAVSGLVSEKKGLKRAFFLYYITWIKGDKKCSTAKDRKERRFPFLASDVCDLPKGKHHGRGQGRDRDHGSHSSRCKLFDTAYIYGSSEATLGKFWKGITAGSR